VKLEYFDSIYFVAVPLCINEPDQYLLRFACGNKRKKTW